MRKGNGLCFRNLSTITPAAKRAPAGYSIEVPRKIMMKMQDIASASREEVLGLAVSSFETGRKAYVTAAKCCIAVMDALEEGETFYGVLRDAGLKDSQIANGRQLCQVWHEWVTAGKMTEDFFDEHLNYSLAVSLNKLTRQDRDMAEAYLDQPEEWKSLADYGLTRADYEEREKAKAKADAEVKRKLEEKRIQEEAAKIVAKSEAQPPATTPEVETTPEEEEPPTVVVDATKTKTEAKTEVKAEPKAKTEAKAEAPSNVVQMDRLPALRTILDKAQEIAVEIARTGDQDRIRQARETIEEYLQAMDGLLSTRDESEAEERKVARG